MEIGRADAGELLETSVGAHDFAGRGHKENWIKRILEQNLKSLLVGKRLQEFLLLLRSSVCGVTHYDEELLARDRDFRVPLAQMITVIR